MRNQPTGWRPWLLFAGTALVVAGASAAIERVNENALPSTLMKGLGLTAGAVAFSIALNFARNRR